MIRLKSMFLLSLISFIVSQFVLNLNVVSATGNPARIADLDVVVARVIGVSVALVGALAVVMLIVGGFHYLTSSGNKEATAKAQHTITFAIIGLILAASAWLIVSFLGTFLGIDIQVFSVVIN